MATETIKAIETIYNGYRFRSRLEARWAVLFDAMGIPYEYEVEGFDLGALGWYLPDFFLPDSGWFVEVKGSMDDSSGIAKARYLDDNPPSGATGVIIVGQPEYAQRRDCVSGPPEFNDAYLTYCLITFNEKSNRMQDYNRAVTAAKSARFEHGEAG